MGIQPYLAAAICLFTVSLTASVRAAEPDQYHLVITYTPGGVVTVPYPTAERCERGRRALEIDLQRRIERRDRNSPPGAMTVGTPYHLQGVCIPG